MKTTNKRLNIICLGGFMEYFEGIIKTLLEHEGYWVRQSFKVNLTKQEKRAIGKPSIPRPEIDLLAFKQKENLVLALEAKSYLDSPGVGIEELKEEHKVPEGRYKLFTCSNYRKIVLFRLKRYLIKIGMADANTKIKLGLVVGNIKSNSHTEKIRALFTSKKWTFWDPEDVKKKIEKLVEKSYENDPAIITAKILMRKNTAKQV
jgi:hypothetical protein